MAATTKSDKKLNQILDRAIAAGWGAEFETVEVDDDIEATYLNISVPAGRNKVNLSIDSSSTDSFAKID